MPTGSLQLGGHRNHFSAHAITRNDKALSGNAKIPLVRETTNSPGWERDTVISVNPKRRSSRCKDRHHSSRTDTKTRLEPCTRPCPTAQFKPLHHGSV